MQKNFRIRKWKLTEKGKDTRDTLLAAAFLYWTVPVAVTIIVLYGMKLRGWI